MGIITSHTNFFLCIKSLTITKENGDVIYFVANEAYRKQFVRDNVTDIDRRPYFRALHRLIADERVCYHEDEKSHQEFLKSKISNSNH